MFCGAGGSSWGARLAGAEIVAGFDLWEAAERAYKRNFPEAVFFRSKLQDLDPERVRRRVGRIDLMLASPECRSHSPARGNGVRSILSRDTAFQVLRFAEILRPRWIVVENVLQMRSWDRYGAFLRRLQAFGYHVQEQTLNAADFGVPQRRTRLFLLCDREQPPSLVKPSDQPRIPVSTILDWHGQYSVSPLRTPTRAVATLQRARRAVQNLGSGKPYLIVYYGSDQAGGWQRLSEPLRTITTIDRFALVRPARGDYTMRMLQVPELKRAMGMPQKFSVGDGNRREQIHLIGNAVCPPVMRAIVRSLTKE